MSDRLVALVPAAGRGARFGVATPKMMVGLAGRPILVWTVERLVEAGADEVVVALSAEHSRRAGELPFGDLPVRLTVGGATRQESVEACLRATPGDPDEWVMVHDGARAAVAVEDVARVVEAARTTGAAILGRPVSDTLKRVKEETVVGTVDRAELFRAETPQVFKRSLLERAYAEAQSSGFVGTDEASLVERLAGVSVRAVAARHPNPKLTEPGDRVLLERLLAEAG